MRAGGDPRRRSNKMKYYIAKNAKALIDADDFNGSFLDAEIDAFMLTGNAGAIVTHKSIYLKTTLYTVHNDYNVTLCTIKDMVEGVSTNATPYEIKAKSLKMIYYDFDEFLETVDFNDFCEKFDYFDIALEHFVYTTNNIATSNNTDAMVSKFFAFIDNYKTDFDKRGVKVNLLFSRTQHALYEKYSALKGAMKILENSINLSDELERMGLDGYRQPKLKDWTDSERIQKDWATFSQS